MYGFLARASICFLFFFFEIYLFKTVALARKINNTKSEKELKSRSFHITIFLLLLLFSSLAIAKKQLNTNTLRCMVVYDKINNLPYFSFLQTNFYISLIFSGKEFGSYSDFLDNSGNRFFFFGFKKKLVK